MSTPNKAGHYQELAQRSRPQPQLPRGAESPRGAEDELDGLLERMKEREERERREREAREAEARKPDPVQALRQLTINELVPIFEELKEKYAATGMAMEMDVSSFLRGGREIKLEFGIKECKLELLGTVTTEAIAFHETRYTPGIRGELVSGPMLRLRHLDGKSFREFVCERLTILLRSAVRKR